MPVPLCSIARKKSFRTVFCSSSAAPALPASVVAITSVSIPYTAWSAANPAQAGAVRGDPRGPGGPPHHQISVSRIFPGFRVLDQEAGMKRLLDRIGELWCIYMHGSAMWPIRGRYLCAVCLREYPVPFEGPVARSNNVVPISHRSPDSAKVREKAMPAPNSIPA